MISFPDDNAHCEDVGCELRDSCLRYIATKQKKKDKGIRVVYISPDPDDCIFYWEIE